MYVWWKNVTNDNPSRQFLMFGCKHCENIVEEPKILSQYLCFQHYKNI